MLDDLRRQIQNILDELLGEGDKLRRALVALGSRDGADTSSASAAPPAARERAGRRAPTAPAAPTAPRNPERSRTSTATASASAERVEPPVSAPADGQARTAARAASGSTKTAVLQALAGGTAMTAGEVATVTGLGRASVSTTLSKLATSGEVTKAARGYQLAGPTAAEVSADVGAGSEDGELGV